MHTVLAFQQNPWYTEGDYSPSTRIEIIINNPLEIERENTPISIPREDLPFTNFGPREVVVVDPSLPPRDEPTRKEKLVFGGHLLQEERNGSAIPYQLDDMNRDGMWDELFFMTDLDPGETKTIYLYLGYNNRGMYSHETFAAVGSYGRHPVPMWESELVTWKLWYPTDVDIQAKRKPMLNGYYSIVNNMSGYHFSYEKGTDLMTVSTSFGGGGIGLFESARSDTISRPRFSPYRFSGPVKNTRYLFEVVASGPIRSTVRVTTRNWRTGQGEYELEQYYTAYKDKYYSTCEVRFTKWIPEDGDTDFGAGIRKIMFETEKYIDDGIVITAAHDMPIIDPNPESLERRRDTVDYAATALLVREKYKPKYQYIPHREGNHTFRIPVNEDLSFEYLIATGWSEAPDYTTVEQFKKYILELNQKYNHPPLVRNLRLEKKTENYRPIEYWVPPAERQ